MASFYDSASIITIPSGYKAGTLYSQIPTDGAGDMTFTRTGDTATRVNSAGLIERCITNLALQSETFNTTWLKGSFISVSENTINNPLTGTATADKIIATSSGSATQHRLDQNTTIAANFYTFSIYAKAAEYSFIQLRVGNNGATFSLIDGSISTIIGGFTARSVSLGNGWYRCIISGSCLLNDVLRINIQNDSINSNFIGDNTSGIFIYGAQFELGDIATEYKVTTTAAVTTGPVTNLPRLDYLNSTCPQLLMEPTRTNLMTYSQMLDNAAWTKVSSASVSGNVLVSPDGYTNADLVTGGASNVSTRITNTFTAVSGTTYAFSGFVKQGPTNAKTAIRMLSNADAILAGINIVFTGGVPAITASGIALNTRSENYGNGWYRISGTYVASASETNKFSYYADTDGTNKNSYLWGAQVEAGTHITSYIPTVAATVTRNQDICTDTGISSLIGQVEGTIFIDFNYNVTPTDNSGRLLQLRDSSDTSNSIVPLINGIGSGATANQFQLSIFASSSGAPVIAGSSTLLIPFGRNKIAIGYNNGSYVFYRNGNLIASGTGAKPLATLTTIDLGNSASVPRNLSNPINQALVFKTRLSNADLATLTTL